MPRKLDFSCTRRKAKYKASVQSGKGLGKELQQKVGLNVFLLWPQKWCMSMQGEQREEKNPFQLRTI